MPLRSFIFFKDFSEAHRGPQREADKDSVMKLLVNLAAPVLSPPRHEAQNAATPPHPLPTPLHRCHIFLLRFEHYFIHPRLFFSPFIGLGGFSFTPFLCFHLLSFHFLALSLPSSSFFPPSVLIFLFPSHLSPEALTFSSLPGCPQLCMCSDGLMAVSTGQH